MFAIESRFVVEVGLPPYLSDPCEPFSLLAAWRHTGPLNVDLRLLVVQPVIDLDEFRLG